MERNIELGKRISSRKKRKVSLSQKIRRWFKDVFKEELLMNKLVSITLICLGVCAAILSKGDPIIPVDTYDCTALVFMLMIGLPLFFSKRNWIC